jgi:hypothetical protein
MIIALIILSSTFTKKIHSSRNTHKHKRGLGTNILRFLLGFGMTFAGLSEAEVNKCLPEAQAIPEPEPSATGAMYDGLAGPLRIVLKVLGTAVDLACKIKSKIVDFLKKRLGLGATRRRLFLQKYKKGGRAYLKKSLKKAGIKIWPFDKIFDFLDSAIDAFKGLKKKIVDFFSSGTGKFILQMVKCVQTLKSGIQTIMGIVKNIQERIARITAQDYSVVVEVIINLVCSWRAFKTAIDYLLAGIADPNPATKWLKIGQFVGQLCNTIGSA